MMRCGLSLGVDGTWSTTQLFPHLQDIITKYLLEFEGKTENGSEVTDKQAASDTEDVLAEQRKDNAASVVIEEALV